MIRKILCLLSFLTLSTQVLAESPDAFQLKRNYLAIGDRSTPIKAEFGFIFPAFKEGNLYLGYHQKSFWDINNGSSPVVDSNYNPQILYKLNEWKDIEWTLGILEHLSNGQTGNRSRGINMSTLQGIKRFKESWGELDLGLKLLATYKMDNGSPDMNNYFGPWAAIMRLKNFIPGLTLNHRFEVRYHSGGKSGTKFENGNLEGGVFLQPSQNALFDLYLQYFTGRNEYFLAYKEYHRNARLGLSFNF